jgi:hypothetical protein
VLAEPCEGDGGICVGVRGARTDARQGACGASGAFKGKFGARTQREVEGNERQRLGAGTRQGGSSGSAAGVVASPAEREVQKFGRGSSEEARGRGPRGAADAMLGGNGRGRDLERGKSEECAPSCTAARRNDAIAMRCDAGATKVWGQGESFAARVRRAGGC